MMAKFDEEAWRKQMARDIADEAALADVNSASDEELRRDLTEMFGTTDYDAIVKAVAEGEGFSKREIKAMQKAGELAKEKLKQGKADEAEKIIMSNRGMREVRKQTGKKGCAVTALVGLGAVLTLSTWGVAEAVGALLG